MAAAAAGPRRPVSREDAAAAAAQLPPYIHPAERDRRGATAEVPPVLATGRAAAAAACPRPAKTHMVREPKATSSRALDMVAMVSPRPSRVPQFITPEAAAVVDIFGRKAVSAEAVTAPAGRRQASMARTGLAEAAGDRRSRPQRAETAATASSSCDCSRRRSRRRLAARKRRTDPTPSTPLARAAPLRSPSRAEATQVRQDRPVGVPHDPRRPHRAGAPRDRPRDRPPRPILRRDRNRGPPAAVPRDPRRGLPVVARRDPNRHPIPRRGLRAPRTPGPNGR